MEAVGESNSQQEKTKRRRPASIRFPAYDLADSVLVAKAIHERGGGEASRDALAAYLEYKTTNSGAYLSRVASARLFGLIEFNGSAYTITDLAQRILMPIRPESAQAGLRDAFLNVPLYKAMFEELHGKQMPPAFGVQNLLRTRFGIATEQAGGVYRTFMDSAETGGFFATRGARTHLIYPQPRARASVEEDTSGDDETPTGGGGGDGWDGHKDDGDSQRSKDALRNEYISILLAALKAKLDKGEFDETLASKIEKLVGIES